MNPTQVRGGNDLVDFSLWALQTLQAMIPKTTKPLRLRNGSVQQPPFFTPQKNVSSNSLCFGCCILEIVAMLEM